MDGFGEYTWTGKRRHQGLYANDMKNGHGQYYWNSGKVYDGQWKDNVQHGYGLMYFPKTKKTKLGVWKNGRFIRWVKDKKGAAKGKESIKRSR